MTKKEIQRELDLETIQYEAEAAYREYMWLRKQGKDLENPSEHLKLATKRFAEKVHAATNAKWQAIMSKRDPETAMEEQWKETEERLNYCIGRAKDIDAMINGIFIELENIHGMGMEALRKAPTSARNLIDFDEFNFKNLLHDLAETISKGTSTNFFESKIKFLSKQVMGYRNKKFTFDITESKKADLILVKLK